MMGGTGSMTGWGGSFWALIIVGIMLLVILAIRLFSGGTNRARPGDGNHGAGISAARRILDERYARGELDTEEYRERLKALGEDT